MAINYKLQKAKKAFELLEEEIKKALPIKKLASYKSEKGLKRFVNSSLLDIELDNDAVIMREYRLNTTLVLWITYQGYNFKTEIIFK